MITGTPLVVTADVPPTWGELQASGFVLLVVGPEPADGVMAPSVQVALDTADSADAAWDALRLGAAGLLEATTAFEGRRDTADGREEQVLEVAHRGAEGGAQVTVYRLLVPRDGGTTLTCVGTVGGGAPADVVDGLRRVVASADLTSEPRSTAGGSDTTEARQP
ncbi:hypothetical protein ACUN7V_15870 [Quadrisphaera oryzae]|uniref:hypothetical protein n=1 Tax=Quadrisphaera TaxID=317661 RepID=UPI00164823EB|nr:hypothetical protein [Quadrisphaera sp. RL12-1S]MBC3764157.1 hypothetical protein [Quadrisphaera sp. RL12-1S]